MTVRTKPMPAAASADKAKIETVAGEAK